MFQRNIWWVEIKYSPLCLSVPAERLVTVRQLKRTKQITSIKLIVYIFT